MENEGHGDGPTNISVQDDTFFQDEPQGTQFSAVIVGGGAAGIAAIGAVLEMIPDRNLPIAWVDPEFSGGRICQKFQEVPSNTKVDLFLSYAKAFEPFQSIIDNSPTPNAITTLQQLPPDGTCNLLAAGDMLKLYSDNLVQHKRVCAVKGVVLEASSEKHPDIWSLSINHSATGKIFNLDSPIVIFCTGSSPKTVSLPGHDAVTQTFLDLEIALKPTALVQTIPNREGLLVGVIGNSHSAVLVLMNLYRLSQTTHTHLRVRWFTRSAHLKYATYKDGQIFFDNSGLKGDAAEFAKLHLDGLQLQQSSVGKVIQRVDCSGGHEAERDAMLQYLPQCHYVVQAIGYEVNKLPQLDRKVVFNHENGMFSDAQTGEVVKGLFGAGIAFPEKVIDPSGSTEYAVGLFKFVKFLKRVVPEWITSTQS